MHNRWRQLKAILAHDPPQPSQRSLVRVKLYRDFRLNALEVRSLLGLFKCLTEVSIKARTGDEIISKLTLGVVMIMHAWRVCRMSVLS